MKQYLEHLEYILENGKEKGDRTGTGTISVFGYQNRYDLKEGFPLVTTKKMFTRGIFHELLWFIKGDTNIQYLLDNDVHIWDEWADENGDLGPVYGKQWRSWETPSGESIDQLAILIEGLKKNPDSRRHIMTAWNPSEVDGMALPPCHCFMQFYVVDGKLSCQLYQRSADMFLGVPFNIASYALFTHMIAQVCGYEVGDFVHTFGDSHIYLNHLDQVKLQLSREPHPLPKLELNSEIKYIEDFTIHDIKVVGYEHDKGIKAPIAV